MFTKKSLILVLGIVVLCGNLFSWVWANETCVIFDPDACDTNGSSGDNPEGTDSLNAGQSVGDLIALGGGHFLKSYSLYLSFLSKFEGGDTDPQSLQGDLDESIANMKKVSAIYKMLIAVAGETPYNPAVIEDLALFDYKNFQAQSGLNPEIFKEVKEYMKNADIYGFYQKQYIHVENLLEHLETIDAKSISLQQLYIAGQKFADAQLFGQYAAQVFVQIKKNQAK